MKIPTTTSSEVSIMGVDIFNVLKNGSHFLDTNEVVASFRVHWVTSEQTMKDAPRGGISTQ
jgi:hypothetical protein